jgi:hypothetical protein
MDKIDLPTEANTREQVLVRCVPHVSTIVVSSLPNNERNQIRNLDDNQDEAKRQGHDSSIERIVDWNQFRRCHPSNHILEEPQRKDKLLR